MKTIGIKLADGSFYPVLQEGSPSEKQLELTTAHNNQTKIMVDLYRSANCTMEDAEYVDSLQIENLNEHSSGEPDISFQVSIDENNELSAKIIDTETGNQSNTTITLVSRTVEERLVTDEYNISDTIVEDTEEEPEDNSKSKLAAAGVVAGAGLLAAASAIRNEEMNSNPEDDFTLGDPDAFADTETKEAVTEEPAEPTIEETIIDEPSLDDFNTEDITTDISTDDSDVSDDLDSPNFDDINIDIPGEESAPTEEFSTSDLDLPDFDSLDSTPAEETITDTSDEPLENTAFNLTEDNPIFEEDATDTSSDETIEADTSVLDFNTDLDMPGSSDETIEESSLPDFDLDLPNDDFSSTETESFDTSVDTTFDSSSEEISPEDDYSLPDFGDIPDTEDSTELSIDDDDLFADTPDEMPSNSSGLSFTGLYDTETELGESSTYEDEVHKKTKVPVIICIVCAVICIIATLLVLFIIPSKYNLLNKKAPKEKPVIEEVIEEPVSEPEPIEETIPKPEPVPEAVEDEVIVIEKAEEVVPLPPPVIEEVKPKNITYKIKWGDTLWDISNTYYKNPWKYKYIARYNGIKDPDYIISGTYIIIPAE